MALEDRIFMKDHCLEMAWVYDTVAMTASKLKVTVFNRCKIQALDLRAKLDGQVTFEHSANELQPGSYQLMLSQPVTFTEKISERTGLPVMVPDTTFGITTTRLD